MSSRSRQRRRPVFLLPRDKFKRCEETGKRGYKSKPDALAVAARASRTGAQRAYRCPHCKRWHLTRKPKRGGT